MLKYNDIQTVREDINNLNNVLTSLDMVIAHTDAGIAQLKRKVPTSIANPIITAMRDVIHKTEMERKQLRIVMRKLRDEHARLS